MANCIPFTYLVGWSNLDKWYYGVRYCNQSNPVDLWSIYFTSSLKVKEYRNIYGEPDVIQVRKIFTNPMEALDYEQKVLKKLKIKTNNRWLNEAIGKPSFKGRKHTKETIQKMKKPKSEGFGEKVKKSNLGKKRSDQTKINISNSKKGFASRSKTWIFSFNDNPFEIFNLENIVETTI